jgi:hypothetical protein
VHTSKNASSGRWRSRHTEAARHFAQKFHDEIFVHFAQILLQICNIPKVTKM